MKKPELLAPAGNMEKLKFALHYGADGVYLAGQRFGLRAKAGNFTLDEIKEGVQIVHDKGKKIYITLNIIPHNEDFIGLKEYVVELDKMKVDGVIVADPGVFKIVREIAPNLKISLSTQANNTNYHSANFWHDNGVKRIVLARELSIGEIRGIAENTPDTLELETFVHGAMCISYSGRCLLSNYLTSRDANKGDCAHPCRWNYTLMEETRENETFPIYEDERGTYIFNSKDLCLIEYIPELIKAGVNSFKIEGRMKSIFYIATVVSTYRKVIDEFYSSPVDYKVPLKYVDELKKVSHREYTTGFALEKPGFEEQNYSSSSYVRGYDFLGVVLSYDAVAQVATIEQRNKIIIGDEIEIMQPYSEYTLSAVKEMWDKEGNPIEEMPHPKAIFKIKIETPLNPLDIIRKKSKE